MQRANLNFLDRRHARLANNCTTTAAMRCRCAISPIGSFQSFDVIITSNPCIIAVVLNMFGIRYIRTRMLLSQKLIGRAEPFPLKGPFLETEIPRRANFSHRA